MQDYIIIYGISNVSLRIAEFLKDIGSKVLVVTSKDSIFMENLKEKNIEFIISDLNESETLKKLSSARSIVLASDDELFNLQIALNFLELNPKIKIILRLFNLNLAEKLQDSIKNFNVLSVSRISSSSFATAALIKNPILSFKIQEVIFSFYELKGDTFSNKKVCDIEKEEVKVISVNNNIFPEENKIISPNDNLIFFSKFSFAKKISEIDFKETPKEKKIKGKKKISFFQLDKILLNTIFSLITIYLFCVIYFHFFENLSLINSFYFVTTVLTTVGFGDINLKEAKDFSKIIGMILMLSGVTLFAILFAIVTDSLMKKRIDLFMGRRKIKLKGHVILCGLGDVGIRILEDLILLGEKVVVIEKNPENKFIEYVRGLNVPFTTSDASLEETLRELNLGEAKSIICATDDDIKNLEIGLNARSLNKGIKVVLRTFDKEFAERIEKNFDIHIALCSPYIAAPIFASAAQGIDIVNILNLGDKKLVLKEKLVDEDFELKEFHNYKNSKILFLHKKDGKIIFNQENFTLQEGDKIYYLTEKI